MTVKELQKLRRQDILQLLLAQSREIARLQEEHTEIDEELIRVEKNNGHLAKRLDEKDVLNHKLEGRLEKKDKQIAELEAAIERWNAHKVKELEEAESVADASLRLNGVYEAAERAADQYLENIRQRCAKLMEKFYWESEQESDWISGWKYDSGEDI